MATDAPARLRLELIPPAPDVACADLAEPVRLWLRQRQYQPTAIQRLAGPALAARNHCLLAAPTGSGKTLAAMLPVLSQLITSPVNGLMRCLYLAPLKALCNDLRRTLKQLLEELRDFLTPEQYCPRIGLRTGDTRAAIRRALLRQPPDILLTTPESLAVLLTQETACRQLADLRWVIVDEVHALADNKRGADLSLSLERLQHLARQPVQRIGLSATCSPLEEAAQFLAGADRSCTICAVSENNSPQIVVEPVGHLPSGEDAHPQRFFSRLLDRLEPEIEAARTTLIFTNTRRLAERVNWALRRRYERWADAIAVHHSSLSAARRRLVERQLKLGLLRVVVSSTSLELGIDIGSVENVVLIHPPGNVLRLLQRVGRAGHGPGRLRRGLILTGRVSELVQAAVTGAAGLSGQLESLRVPAHPLDVLCQHLLAFAATQTCQPDDIYHLVRRAYPYRNLPRQDFDDCLNFLLGRFTPADSRTLRILRCNLGTILSEVPLTVRLTDATPVGELERAYANRLLPGDRFLLDGRCLEFRRMTGNSILVEEVPGRPLLPQWSGNGWPLSTELAERVFCFRVRAAEALLAGPENLIDLLEQDYRLSAPAAELLATHFERQEALSEIPDSTTCLIECVRADQGVNYFFHTPLNRTANEALSRVLHCRLQKAGRRAVVPAVADLGFVLSLESPMEIDADQWRALLRPDCFFADLQESLADGPLLFQRFRQVANIGLLLLRNNFGKSSSLGGHDWAERRLFQQLQTRDPDFVLLRQARREIETELLDAPAAFRFTQEMANRSLRLRWLPCISPFAESWTQLAYHAEEVATNSGAAT